jgi:hypothetical protein
MSIPEAPGGYEYRERHVAPNVVEFVVLTPQGHRVVRIFLDSHNPRFTAFNEVDCKRSPAILYLQEVLILIDRARQIVNPETKTINPTQRIDPNEDRTS